jgi:superfamily II DNA/RNA helicase
MRAMSAAARPPALLDAGSVGALRALGLDAIDTSGASLFEAQRACWPAMSNGSHTFVTAPTGTGKSVLAVLRACTVATRREEGTPALHPSAGIALPKALIVAPTRELADQHVQVATKFLDAIDERAGGALLIAGGEKHAVQRRALAAAQPAIVVGTPGRILAHVAQNHLSLHRVR